MKLKICLWIAVAALLFEVVMLKRRMNQVDIVLEKYVLAIVAQGAAMEGLSDLGFKQTLAIDLLQQTDGKLLRMSENNMNAIIKNHYKLP